MTWGAVTTIRSTEAVLWIEGPDGRVLWSAVGFSRLDRQLVQSILETVPPRHWSLPVQQAQKSVVVDRATYFKSGLVAATWPRIEW